MYHFPMDSSTAERDAQKLRTYQDKDLEEVLQQSDWPIGNLADRDDPHCYGVARIDNIPYAVTRQEVTQMFGRYAALIPSSQCPVHIIMDRSTGKTVCCFAEFESCASARAAVDHVNAASDSPIGPRMGNRNVVVSMSSQEELMRALFPMAKCLSWVEDRFVPHETGPDEWWSSGFDGFITDEELFCLTGHAKEPHRSAFAGKVPQRSYESINSIIWKFPWYATNMYTVHARNRLFDALLMMVELLLSRVTTARTVGLDYRLVSELIQTGLRCPAFNPRMKYALVEAGHDHATLSRMSREYLSYFPFDTLTWLSPYDVASLTYYASLMCRGRVSRAEQQGLENRHTDPMWIQPYGRQLFAWNDVAAVTKTFADAITYELGTFRSLLIAGYGNTGLHSRVSSIGTAPPNSPSHRGSPTSSSPRTTVNTPRPGNTSTSNTCAPSWSNAADDFHPPYHCASQSWDPSVTTAASSSSQSRRGSNIWQRRPAYDGDASSE